MTIFGNLFKSKKELHKIRLTKINNTYDKLVLENAKKSSKFKSELPLVKANNTIESALRFFQLKLIQLVSEWDQAYENFSWWNKIKYLDGPDYSEIETRIRDLEKLNANFKSKHGDNLSKLNSYLEHQFNLYNSRIEKAYDCAVNVQNQYQNDILEADDLIRKATWCAILSVPISASMDFITAHNIYDSLRKVNSNFSGLSDNEIWWETLWMRPESLQGLASLTKGAYFEELVAVNTGGQLFEHFNNPSTDIVIDGVEIQIKATDRVSYIHSVDDNIPIIATSEVALATGVIDGGYTNEEIANSVDIALGGSVVDIPDSFVDALLTGAGGLGVLATLNGLAHAKELCEKGEDPIGAYFAGAGVAIAGTAEGLVNVAETTHKVVMSGPSRFVGRIALKGAIKLDKKLFGE